MNNDREKVTQPMLEVLLDRIQSLETRLEDKLLQTSDVTNARLDAMDARLDAMGGRLDRLEQQLGALRTEMNENFLRVFDEMAILNDDVLKTRGGQRDLRRRVEVLESKVP